MLSFLRSFNDEERLTNITSVNFFSYRMWEFDGMFIRCKEWDKNRRIRASCRQVLLKSDGGVSLCEHRNSCLCLSHKRAPAHRPHMIGVGRM